MTILKSLKKQKICNFIVEKLKNRSVVKYFDLFQRALNSKYLFFVKGFGKSMPKPVDYCPNPSLQDIRTFEIFRVHIQSKYITKPITWKPTYKKILELTHSIIPNSRLLKIYLLFLFCSWIIDNVNLMWSFNKLELGKRFFLKTFQQHNGVSLETSDQNYKINSETNHVFQVSEERKIIVQKRNSKIVGHPGGFGDPNNFWYWFLLLILGILLLLIFLYRSIIKQVLLDFFNLIDKNQCFSEIEHRALQNELKSQKELITSLFASLQKTDIDAQIKRETVMKTGDIILKNVEKLKSLAVKIPKILNQMNFSDTIDFIEKEAKILKEGRL